MLTTKNMPANAGLAAFSAQQRIAFILIVSISFLMGISIDLYVPSLPAISHYYHSTIASVEISISLYLLGYGLGQTVLGILSDSYGRKKYSFTPRCVFYYPVSSVSYQTLAP